MPQVSSPLDTTQRYIPLVSPGRIGRAGGFFLMFTNLAALNAAVEEERNNVTDGMPVWGQAQPLSIANEMLLGIHRIWSVSGNHARTAILKPGSSVLLPNDNSNILSTIGVPSSSTGVNGDVAVDYNANLYYIKAFGAWGTGVIIDPSLSGFAASLASHAADATIHLTSAQNTLLDGLDLPNLTATHLNRLIGVTSSVQGQLDTLFTNASTFTSHIANGSVHLSANERTLLSGLNLPTLTAAEVNRLVGVTSPIQTQINNLVTLANTATSHASDASLHLTANQNTFLDSLDFGTESPATKASSVNALSAHLASGSFHLTSFQNTFLDTIETAGTTSGSDVLKLAGANAASILTSTDIPSVLALMNGSGVAKQKVNTDGTLAFTGDQSMGNHRLTSVADPVAGGDAVNRDWALANLQGLRYKQSVYVAATTNVTLSGDQTLDGVLINSHPRRVFLPFQTDPAENGVWDTNAGAWTRSTDADSAAELTGSGIIVQSNGTLYHDTVWVQYGTITTLGTDPVTFNLFPSSAVSITAGSGVSVSGSTVSVRAGSGLTFGSPTAGDLALNVTAAFTLGTQLDLANVGTAGTYFRVTTDSKGRVTAGLNPTTLSGFGITDGQPLNANLTALAALATVGMVARTGSNTYATRSLAVSGIGLSITDPTGAAGNPTITSNATSANTASTIVARDASGNFSAGTITATLAGNASSATTATTATSASTLTNARTIAISGGATGTATSFNGSANISIPVTALDATVLTGTIASARLSGTYAISISGNATTATTATTATNATTASTATRATAADSVAFWAGTAVGTPSHAIAGSGSQSADLAPNTFTRGIFAEVKNSSLFGFTGTLTGLVTVAPVVGTVASSGDPNYQLAFSPSASNSTATPSLRLRAGIDTTWGAWMTLLHSSNFNIYAPTLTGTGASGTWGISITGNAATATTATNATNATSVPWSGVTGTPTTRAGYGITDAQPLNSALTALAAFATNGIIVRTAANTYAGRSIAALGVGLSVTNADGVSGNPTVTSNATNINTPSTIVARDASGNFAASAITSTTLDANGSITVLGGANQRQIGFSFSGTPQYNLFVDGSVDASRMAIRSGSSVVATFDGSGNLSLGTSVSGGPKLDVAGSIRASGTLTVLPTATSIMMGVAGTSVQQAFVASTAAADAKVWDTLVTSAGTMNFRVLTDALGSPVNWMTVTRNAATVTSVVHPNGNFGIGGNPLHKFTVTAAGTAALMSVVNTDGAQAYLQANANTDTRVGSLTAHDLNLVIAGAPMITVDTSGNLLPFSNNARQLGLTGARWSTVNSVAGSFTGTVTAAQFSGPLSGTVTGSLIGNVTGNVSGSSGSTTGNAATATILQSTRTINGVGFNGSADITIFDATKLPLTGGTLSGVLNIDSGEAIRLRNSGGFISGWNNAVTVRTGYLQFVAGTSVSLVAEGSHSAIVQSAGGSMTIAPGGTATFTGSVTATGFNGNATSATTAATATNVAWTGITGMPVNTNWATVGVNTVTVGALAWRNYGNGHVIFDASAGLSPTGGAVNNTTPANTWSATYPTLMGWNGSSTYGVRVDVARLADTATALATARTINGVSFNGTANITVADSTKLPLAGGQMTGLLEFSSAQTEVIRGYSTSMYISGYNNAGSVRTGYLQFNSGSNVTLMADNSTYLHLGTTGGNIQVTAAGNVTMSGSLTVTGDIQGLSDPRLKTDVRPIENPLEIIAQLNGVYFTHISTGERSIGFLADNVNMCIPEATSRTADDYLTVKYGNITGLFAEGFKKLMERMNMMEEEMAEMKKRFGEE